MSPSLDTIHVANTAPRCIPHHSSRSRAPVIERDWVECTRIVSVLSSVACIMDLNLTVRRTDSAATENADRLRLIFTVPTFHSVILLMPRT